MPEAMNSLIGKEIALVSISPSPSTPERQQNSEDDEMAEHQSSASPPRKVIKSSISGIIDCWYTFCGCKVHYCIQRVEESLYRITGGETTIDVPFNRNHVHFDCPCGYRCEITMGVRSVGMTAQLVKIMRSQETVENPPRGGATDSGDAKRRLRISLPPLLFGQSFGTTNNNNNDGNRNPGDQDSGPQPSFEELD